MKHLQLVAFIFMGVVCVILITNLPQTKTETNVYGKSMRVPVTGRTPVQLGIAVPTFDGGWTMHMPPEPVHNVERVIRMRGWEPVEPEPVELDGAVQTFDGGWTMHMPPEPVHDVKRTTTTTTTRTRTTTKRWKTRTELKYDVVAAVINALNDAGIDAFLYGGSALGAYRNHGWFSWDKDADLLVLSSNHGLIQSVLDALPSISNYSTHMRLNSGHKYGVTDFGYHIVLPPNDSHLYIDLWLAEHLPGNQIRLVSGDAWCDAVGQRSRASCKPMPKEWFYPPLIVPYGPYLMPTPRSKYVETSKVFFFFFFCTYFSS